MSLERYESVAQSRVLRVPVVFDRTGAFELFDEKGNPYFDFCSGGYGHNAFDVHAALKSYLSSGRIIGSSDRECVVKRRFVDEFTSRILDPRNMRYRIVFADPASGTAAEAAIRLARRSKKRPRIVAFTHSCHGLTEASLAVTSRSETRRIDPLLASSTTFMPFCDFFGSELDTIRCFRRYLEDPASGLDRPAAVIVETIQVHGGVRIASPAWLQAMADLCLEFGMLLIVDEAMTGCGATGPYFSFENIGLVPDMIVAPNAIAGGLAMSMLLVRPSLDVSLLGMQPGGLRGNALAFAAATALLDECAASPHKGSNSRILGEELQKLATRDATRRLRVRGRGMVWGLDFGRPGAAAVVAAWTLERGVLVEPAYVSNDVLLVRPAITIDETTLREGLDRLDEAVSDFLDLS